MIIQKLRLESGWSQQQLADMSGLSIRTIQRIEKGKTPSVESIKSLASVFEIEYPQLQELLLNHSAEELNIVKTPASLALSLEEQIAYGKVRDLKDFYGHLVTFIIVNIVFFFVDLFTSPGVWWIQWMFLSWGIGVTIHAVQVFDILNPFGAEWEKRALERFKKK